MRRNDPRAEDNNSYAPETEKCLNPWNGECGKTDIAIYVMYNGERLPICRRCWEDISTKDVEWM